LSKTKCEIECLKHRYHCDSKPECAQKTNERTIILALDALTYEKIEIFTLY